MNSLIFGSLIFLFCQRIILLRFSLFPLFFVISPVLLEGWCFSWRVTRAQHLCAPICTPGTIVSRLLQGFAVRLLSQEQNRETFKKQSQSWHEKEVDPCQATKNQMHLALCFTSACKAPVLNWSAWLCNQNSNVSGVERWWFHTPSSLRKGK